jgi:beta-N-acetylhexosaminidase
MLAEEVVDRLSLEEKVGQVLLLAFAGPPDAGPQRLIERYGLGGVYMSQENAGTPEDAARLSSLLQGQARATRSGLPLFVAADHEGAWGVLAPDATTGPGNLGLGAARDARWTEAMYAVLATELRAVGYNTLLAPCVDVNSNAGNAIIGMRSFGDDAQQVATLAAAAVRGAQTHGVIAVAKHFPGHGDTVTDTHRGLAVVDRPDDAVRATELLPFRAAIAAGVGMVMTSHILYTAFDPAQPATLSSRLLQGVLREELGFQGVIISDSMNMASMSRTYPPGEAEVLALLAGVDMLMLAEEHYAHDPATYLDRQIAIIESLLAAATAGRLPMSRLNEAVRRIIALKFQAGLLDQPLPAPDQARLVLGNPVHRQVAAAAAAAGVTLLGDAGNLLPLAPGTSLCVVNVTSANAYAVLARTRGIGPNQSQSAFAAFAQAVRLRVPQAVVLPAEEAFQRDGALSALLPPSGVVVAVSENYPLPGEDFDTVAQLPRLRRLIEAMGSRLVIVALRDPYDLPQLDLLPTCFCTCSFRPESAAAAVAVLFGEAPAPGRLPVRP